MSAPVFDFKITFRPGFQADMDARFARLQFAFSQKVADVVDKYVPLETGTLKGSVNQASDFMRAQARIVMHCIDEILGAGASDRLGLDENNAAPIYDVLDAINEACKAEKQHYADRIPKPQPMNRAQRRAEKKARQRTQTAGHIVSQQPVSFPAQPPAAQMVERVDKAARRKALLAELAALEND